jgi:hypothetical protein
LNDRNRLSAQIDPDPLESLQVSIQAEASFRDRAASPLRISIEALLHQSDIEAAIRNELVQCADKFDQLSQFLHRPEKTEEKVPPQYELADSHLHDPHYPLPCSIEIEADPVLPSYSPKCIVAEEIEITPETLAMMDEGVSALFAGHDELAV